MPTRPPTRCTDPRCRTLHHGTGRCGRCRAARAEQTRHATPWRWVYATRRWALLRDQILSQQPVCACGCGRPSQVVDHITPHRGDPALAFDPANLQAMAKPCHDAKTAAETLNPGPGGTDEERAISARAAAYDWPPRGEGGAGSPGR